MVQYSDTGGGSMSYTAKVFYVLESDPTYTLMYDSLNAQISIGNSFSVSFSDFDYNGTHYYVKYAINNGDVYKRGVNTIDCKSMMISDDYRYMSWYVFCTEDEADITGDCAVSRTDIAKELYLSISTGNSDSVSTRGKETLISVSISQGCVSDSFASYGSTYSPTMSCEMYAENNDFTDALIAKTYYDNTVKGTIVNAWILIGNEFAYPVPIGRFVVKENPTYNGETVSFTGNGLMSEYMDRAEIAISSLNRYHEEELEKKYVKGFRSMDFIRTNDDVYYWEYLPQDFLRVTGCPLHIDNWDSILIAIGNYGLQQLMIPMLSDASYDEENGYNISWETRITWRDFLSGIAIILRANVIEKNGAFYIKQLPQLQKSGTYRPIFDGNSYDSSAIFGNNLMCPNNISVKANNWYFYKPNNTVVGFGYYEGESTVVLNDKASEVSNVENYPVTIESPWILYETLNRAGNQYNWFGRNSPMQWKDGLQFLNKAFVYHKASIETMYWHPLMSVGEMLTFEDYDGVKKYVLVGEMTLHYDGGFYAEITSPCEVQESNASSVGSSGSNSYNSGTMAQASGTVTSTILGAIFKDGVITNSKIADSTITGSKIAESTIDNSNIKDSTITGSKFEDGTIENSKIKDSTLTGAKIEDATIGIEKVNESFISDLTAKNAFISNLTATVAKINSLTATDAIIKNIFSNEIVSDKAILDVLQANIINAEYIKTAVADVGYITADEADLSYANITLGNIDTANIDKANIGLLFNEVGLIDRATIVDGHVTGFLDSVEVNANKITAGTLIADRILLKGSESGLLYALNNLGELTSTEVDTLDGTILTQRTVTADKLVANSITANELDVTNIFGNSAVLTTLTSQQAFINAISTNSVVVGASNTANNALNTVNGLEIGGANILRGTNGVKGTGYWYNGDWTIGSGGNGVLSVLDITNSPDVSLTKLFKISGNTSGNRDIMQRFDSRSNLCHGQYTFSCWLRGNCKALFRIFDYTSNVARISKTQSINSSTNWTRFTHTFTVDSSWNTHKIGVNIGLTGAGSIEICGLKLEVGSKATAWQPSQLDISVENVYTKGTTTIDGGKITTGSIKAEKIDVTDLSALNATIGGFDITDSGISKSYTKSGEVLGKDDSYSIEISSNGIPSYKGASYVWEDSSTKSVHEYTFGDYLTIDQYMNLGGNDIKQQWYRTEIGNTYAGALTISRLDTSGAIEYKTSYGFGYLSHYKYEDGNLSSAAPFDIRSPLKISSNVNASLTHYDLQISASTGNHMNLGQGTIQAVTKDNKVTNLYLNSYGGNVQLGNDSSNMTIGGANSTSIKIANKELIGVLKGTTPTIVTRTLTLNAMSLAGNYDGETTGTIESVSGYVVLAVIPRTSAATDVCWINCYFDSSNVVHARLKNTSSSAKNNFKPTVEVLYRLI